MHSEEMISIYMSSSRIVFTVNQVVTNKPTSDLMVGSDREDNSATGPDGAARATLAPRYEVSYIDAIDYGGSARILSHAHTKHIRNHATSFPSRRDFDNNATNPGIKRYVDQGNSNGKPIDYSIGLARRIHDYLLTVKSKDLRYEIVPADIVDVCGNELKRFMCALEAYRKSEGSIMSITYLIDGILDIDFAKKLKRIRTKSFIKTAGNRIIDVQPEFEESDWYQLTDIGQIFNYNYWFFWKEEAEDDLAYSRIPCKRLSEDSKKTFKRVLKSILPDRIATVEEDEILFTNSGSMGLEKKTYRSRPVYDLKQRDNTFASVPDVTKRSHIYVGPANIRDTVIQSVPRTNSVKLIERQCAEIVEDLVYSAHIRDPGRFESLIQKFQEKYIFFFNRDIEKEGITKPRELVSLTLEVLSEVYPHLPAWRYRHIYDDWLVYDKTEGKISHTDRGHGLGMANSLTTIIQCVIFRIILERLNAREYIVDEIDAIFLNDDCTIGFRSQDDFDSYLDAEEEVFEEYRLRRKLSKSHYGRGFVFCEIYYYEFQPGMNRKLSYSLTEIYNIFAATNIVHAKMISSNLSRHVLCDQITAVIDEIVRFWSYEFFEDEWKYPMLFGGWISPTYLGVRLDFLYAKTDYEVLRACNSVLSCMALKKKLKGGGKEIYRDPISARYSDLKIDEILQNRINYRVPFRKIFETMSKFNDRSEAEKAFERLYDDRKNEYKRSLDCRYTLEELYDKVIKEFETKDFLPPQDIILRYDWEDLSAPIRKRRPYRSANPLLSALAVNNREKFPYSIIPEKFSFLYDLNSRKMTASERALVHRYLSYARGTEIFGVPPIDYSDTIGTIGHEWYIDPERVRSASEAFYVKAGVPIPSKARDWKPRFTEKEIKLKEILFGYKSDLYRLALRKADEDFIIDRVYALDYDDVVEIANSIRDDRVRQIEEEAEAAREEVPETDSESEEADPPSIDDTPWGPDEFWMWRDNKFSPRSRNCIWINIFETIDDIMHTIQLNAIAGELRMRERVRIDDLREMDDYLWCLVRTVWAKSGGAFDEHGNIALGGTVQSDSDSDLDGAGFDIFDVG